MTDLTLAPSGVRPSYNRYAAGKRRSPGALAAAVAINGGVFALLLAMPATQYITGKSGDLTIKWVEIQPVPPENPPEPIPLKNPPPTKNEIVQPVPDPLPYVAPPVTPLPGDNFITGRTEPIQAPSDPVIAPPLPQPHVPVFKAATRDPRFAQAFHPEYPPALRRMELEGSVTVRVTIDAKGRVIAVELVDATDPAFFRETRDQALRHWRFLPATRDGKPVESQQTLTVQFRLDA